MIKLILLVLAAAPAAALADDYRFDAQGAFDWYQPSDDFFGDADTTNLTGTWYFAPVSTTDVPLAEAAFLGRSSRVSAVLARYELFGEHLNAQAASVGYYFPGTMFYASAGVQRIETLTALSSTFVQTEYDTAWFGQLGIAPLKGLLLTTSFQEDGYDPNITARYVGKLPNSHYYAGSVSLVEPDWGDTSFGLDFDYYFDHTASVGIGYADGAERWELRAQKFLSESWALGASVSTDDFGDGFGIRLTWRH